MIKFLAISPHPPIIIPTIGTKEDHHLVSKTIEGMKKLGELFQEKKVDTLIIVSPHAPVDLDFFTVLSGERLCGNFQMFGDFETKLCFDNDKEIIEKIKQMGKIDNIPLRFLNINSLDHGTLVPLYYLSKKFSHFKLVSIAYSFLNREEHLKFGNTLFKIMKNSPKNIAFVASGDLSHRLIPGAPAGFSPYGKEFDEKLIRLLRRKDIEGILNLDPEFVEEAGECGYRSIIILLGILKNLNWEPEIISYEGPFGVGYLVANFKIK